MSCHPNTRRRHRCEWRRRARHPRSRSRNCRRRRAEAESRSPSTRVFKKLVSCNAFLAGPLGAFRENESADGTGRTKEEVIVCANEHVRADAERFRSGYGVKLLVEGGERIPILPGVARQLETTQDAVPFRLLARVRIAKHLYCAANDVRDQGEPEKLESVRRLGRQNPRGILEELVKTTIAHLGLAPGRSQQGSLSTGDAVELFEENIGAIVYGDTLPNRREREPVRATWTAVRHGLRGWLKRSGIGVAHWH